MAERRVLMVIDVQGEYFPKGQLPIVGSKASGNLESYNRIKELQQAFATNGHLVVLVQHVFPFGVGLFEAGTEGWKIPQEILDGPHDLLIHKTMPDAFAHTNLWPWLMQKGMDTGLVTICGYQTHMCCTATAFSALSTGYSVEFAKDAMGSPNLSNQAGQIAGSVLHDAVLIGVQQFDAVDVRTTAQIIGQLQPLAPQSAIPAETPTTPTDVAPD